MMSAVTNKTIEEHLVYIADEYTYERYLDRRLEAGEVLSPVLSEFAWYPPQSAAVFVWFSATNTLCCVVCFAHIFCRC